MPTMETPTQTAAAAALTDAARVLLDAAHAYDVAITDASSASDQPLGTDHALVALAGAVADRAHRAGDLRLEARPYTTGGDVVHVPTGRRLPSEVGSLSVQVVGDSSASGPSLLQPLDPDALALGAAGLRDRAEDCALESAGEVRHGAFAELVAVSALARLDLPLVLTDAASGTAL